MTLARLGSRANCFNNCLVVLSAKTTVGVHCFNEVRRSSADSEQYRLFLLCVSESDTKLNQRPGHPVEELNLVNYSSLRIQCFGLVMFYG